MGKKIGTGRPDVELMLNELKASGLTMSAVFKDVIKMDITNLYFWRNTGWSMRDDTYKAILDRVSAYKTNGESAESMAAVTAKIDANGALMDLAIGKTPKEALTDQYLMAIDRLEAEQQKINVELNAEQQRIDLLRDRHLAVTAKKIELEETIRSLNATYGMVMGYAAATESN